MDNTQALLHVTKESILLVVGTSPYNKSIATSLPQLFFSNPVYKYKKKRFSLIASGLYCFQFTIKLHFGHHYEGH